MKTHSTYNPDGSIMAIGKPFDGTPRPGYALHHSIIGTSKQFKATLRAGAYAWPDGYPLYFIMEDSEVMCFDCAKKEAKRIIYAMRSRYRDGWKVAGCDVNYDDSDLVCCHCKKFIESAC